MKQNTSRAEMRAISTYVPALTEPRPRVEVIDVDAIHLPAAPQMILMPTANYTDRARGFALSTTPLAGATGVVVVLLGVSAFGVPFLSVAALLLALGGFTGAWLVAYVAHTMISPDGTLFVHTMMAWGYLRVEQRERIHRYREVTRKGRFDE